MQGCGHTPDARLATTLIRVCSQHGQALTALGLYDWMRATRAGGGASLTPTVFTYTAAMRAALAGNLLTRAFQVLLSDRFLLYGTRLYAPSRCASRCIARSCLLQCSGYTPFRSVLATHWPHLARSWRGSAHWSYLRKAQHASYVSRGRRYGMMQWRTAVRRTAAWPPR